MTVMSDLDYEDTLLHIARTLPPNRAAQLLDFARFLEAQLLGEALFRDEAIADVDADNDQWDALLATDDGQTLLETLAQEALAEYKAGNTRSMVIDNQGRIVPG